MIFGFWPPLSLVADVELGVVVPELGIEQVDGADQVRKTLESIVPRIERSLVGDVLADLGQV